jgi:DNA-binding YbaB/EbfC family protein
MGDMLQKVQQLQEEMAKTQESLADETMTVTAGGGAIEITITGHQRLVAVKIDPDVVDPEDVEMLQDLIVAAVNEAIEQSQTMAAEKLNALTGGLGLPPGLGLG